MQMFSTSVLSTRFLQRRVHTLFNFFSKCASRQLLMRDHSRSGSLLAHQSADFSSGLVNFSDTWGRVEHAIHEADNNSECVQMPVTVHTVTRGSKNTERMLTQRRRGEERHADICSPDAVGNHTEIAARLSSKKRHERSLSRRQ